MPSWTANPFLLRRARNRRRGPSLSFPFSQKSKWRGARFVGTLACLAAAKREAGEDRDGDRLQFPKDAFAQTIALPGLRKVDDLSSDRVTGRIDPISVSQRHNSHLKGNPMRSDGLRVERKFRGGSIGGGFRGGAIGGGFPWCCDRARLSWRLCWRRLPQRRDWRWFPRGCD